MAFLKENFQQIGRAFLDFCFPPLCLRCQALIKKKKVMICDNCLSELKPFPENLYEQFLSRMDASSFDRLFIAFEFNETIQFILHHLKYNGYHSFAEPLAEGFKEYFKNGGEYDIITSVPLHKARLRQRGYNQSTEIARHISRIGSIPYDGNLVFRKKYTDSQTKLNRSERIHNVSGVFEMGNIDIKGKSVILVDDVITTGATVNACATVLKRAKCKRVTIFAAATPVTILQEQLEREKPDSDLIVI